MEKHIIITIILVILFLLLLLYSQGPHNVSNVVDTSKNTTNSDRTVVTPFNFIRAETDMYFKKMSDLAGATNTFYHYRTIKDSRDVVRMNKDTLYSIAVLDLNQSPVQINMPRIDDRIDDRIDNRYQSIALIDQDHYEVGFYQSPVKLTLHRNMFNTRYLIVIVRTLVKNPSDVKKVNAIQNSMQLKAKSKGQLIVPIYDTESYDKVKGIIGELNDAAGNFDSRNMFGKKDEVDPMKHLLGTLTGWGGLSQKHAIYEIRVPSNNDGHTEYQITLDKKVPVQGFWSITVYDKDGYLVENSANHTNNYTAKPNDDGTITINFSNDPKKINNLTISDGWQYTVRLYEPESAIIDGRWKFPPERPTSISNK